MSNVTELYRRLDAWARTLSRIRYAALVGVVSLLSSLLGSTLFGDPATVQAVTMGVTLAILCYAFNPNQQA